ncbi:MAG: hypothetical protein M4579_001467 [Chaenotheca gracillima]|nr:MAG: hypothetical protein M4579_001467 [Chaenotheca gracillima]
MSSSEDSTVRGEDASVQQPRHVNYANGTNRSAANGTNEVNGSNGAGLDEKKSHVSNRADGKIEIQEEDCYEALGFCYPTWKKWMILTVIFAVQTSMNFNTSVYSNVVTPLSEAFGVSEQAARVGQMIFLVAYAFGSELWAPWSEDFGRWPILQLSLFLVNIWQLPCALAKNFGTIVVGRFLGGLSSAGGSVTLGMVADMWEADDQQYAVAYVVLSSVGGSILGPIVGAFIQNYLSWQWNFWIQLIFGGVVQAMHFFLVPETRSSIILDKQAKKRRKAGEENIWGPNELKKPRISMKEVFKIWARPFIMFVSEPIVLSLSLLSGNALARDFLAGIAAMYSTPFYKNLAAPYTLEKPTTILACLALLVTIPIYIFYWKGPAIRERSKFAQTLASDRKARGGRRVSSVGIKPESGHIEQV